MASAGPYASLHLAPDRQPHQHPTTLFFTGRMPFLPPNEQCHSTEGIQTSVVYPPTCSQSCALLVDYGAFTFVSVCRVVNVTRPAVQQHAAHHHHQHQAPVSSPHLPRALPHPRCWMQLPLVVAARTMIHAPLCLLT